VTAKVNLGLCALFDKLLLFEESGYAPISILHRISTEGLVGRSGRAGHVILCRELNPYLRKLWTAVRGLETKYQIVIVTKHMPCPRKEDGALLYKYWGDREKAHYLTEETKEFILKYQQALRKIKKNL